MKSFRPYAIAIVLFLIWVSCQSCGSSCRSKKRYWRKHRCVELQRDTIPQYLVINNQILIIENRA
jgi:hypothetical protein